MTGVIKFNDELFAEIMIDIEDEHIVLKVNGETVYDSGDSKKEDPDEKKEEKERVPEEVKEEKEPVSEVKEGE